MNKFELSASVNKNIIVIETKKAEAQKLKAEIYKTDKKMKQMVYELYGLCEEELKLLKGNETI